MLIEEPGRPERETTVGIHLRGGHHRFPAHALEVVKRCLTRMNQPVPDGYAYSVHEVVAVRFGDHLHTCQRSSNRQLGQFRLAQGMQVSLPTAPTPPASARFP